MKVSLFFRKSRPGYNSIEELFTTISSAYPPNIECCRIELPSEKATLSGIIKNLKLAWKYRNQICHITGDVHYIAIVTGAKTVLTIHDVYSAIQGNFLKKFLIKVWWFWIPALFTYRITTISEKSRKEIEQVIPFAKKKIIVIPNPTNPSLVKAANSLELKKAHTKPIILHVGTKKNKNLERLIEALAELNCKLLLLGKPQENQKRLLARYKIDYRVYYNLPIEDVANLYQQCDLVCFASLYEGFGMPIIEAQAIGKPVITSDIDPMNWVAGGGAHLVDPLSVTSIRDGVQKVLSDEEYKKSLISKGYENIWRFEPERIAHLYLEVYRKVEMK